MTSEKTLDTYDTEEDATLEDVDDSKDPKIQRQCLSLCTYVCDDSEPQIVSIG
jgi:hypothetical protein